MYKNINNKQKQLPSVDLWIFKLFKVYGFERKWGKAYKNDPIAQKNDEIAIARGICDLVKKYEMNKVAIKLPNSKHPDKTPLKTLENSNRFSIVVITLFL